MLSGIDIISRKLKISVSIIDRVTSYLERNGFIRKELRCVIMKGEVFCEIVK